MLTEKQIEFCKLIVTNKNGLDAYSIAFNTTNEGTAKAASSRLLKRDDIKLFISELQAENKKLRQELAIAKSIFREEGFDGAADDIEEALKEVGEE
jgi:phage terminase small subunit